MNDATDVSLETDRLDHFLEVAAPAQPVVMIQYRNRGVPWWVLVPLLVLGPLMAILIYHQSVVERYRAQAMEATHLMETWAQTAGIGVELETNPTAGSGGASLPTGVAKEEPQPKEGAPSELVASPSPAGSREAAVETKDGPTAILTVEKPVAPANSSVGTRPAPGRSEPAPATVGVAGSTAPSPPAAGQPVNPPRADSQGIAPNASVAGAAGTSAAGIDPPPRTRVRSIFPSPFPFETDGPAAASNGVAGESNGAGAESPAQPGPEQAHRLEPLPSREQSLRQFAQEAARKTRELAEQQAIREDSMRASRIDDRIKFHEELREILAAHGKRAGPEIDKLALRHRNDHKSAAFDRAKKVWRSGRMSQASKVSSIRSLDIPEADILNFLSDNLFARMRTPGGPRDTNEVRVRAAQLLLSYELPRAVETPDTTADPAKVIRPPGPGGPRTQ